MQYGIADEDIYNFNKTGFTMGLIATAKVVIKAEIVSQPFLIQLGNYEQVTSIECVNCIGWALLLCIIFKGKVHIKGWYKDNALPCDQRIKVSVNSQITNEIRLCQL